MESQYFNGLLNRTRSKATSINTPTPTAAMTTRDQSGPFGEMRDARTERSGSAIVAKKPIKKPMKRSQPIVFFLVKVAPTISPILAKDFSTPKLKKAVPTIKGIADMSKEVRMGPNLDPSISRRMSGTHKGTRTMTAMTGNIAKMASLNLGQTPWKICEQSFLDMWAIPLCG